MMNELKISRTVSFPLDAVTQTFGVLAKRGAGKSNTAAVMAEEMFDAGLPFVVVDPVGAWWGLRSAGQGKAPGLSIPIFGGYHGDVPLERGGAELIADLIVDESLSCVLDVSAFDSEAAKREFLAMFAERLFRRKGQPGKGTPLHLFLEEADDYAPQRTSSREGGMARCLGAFQRIVKQGRARGLGSTMISQRSASLNKDLLTQIETLIVLRTTSPQDRKAIEAWVEYHGESEELLESLHELADGEAWIWSPWMRIVKRVQIRRRRTFDSGATPTLSAARKQPATLADVDLEAIRVKMAGTIERAKEDDPRLLRVRVRELEKELSLVKASTPEPEQIRVEVPVVQEKDVERLEAAVKDVVRGFEGVQAALMEVRDIGGKIHGLALRYPMPDFTSTARTVPQPRSTQPVSRPQAAQVARSSRAKADMGDVALGKAERAILTVLARYPHGKAKRHLGGIAGYAWKGGSFNNSLSALNVRGLIQRGDPIRITDEGLTAIEGQMEDLPAPGDELVAYWSERLGKAERLILGALAEAYPNTMTKEEVAEVTGYEAKGGSYNNSVSRLRVLELIEGKADLKASDSLMVG